MSNTSEDYISPEKWGRDHLSTLLYMETRLCDYGGLKIVPDPRMRTKRRMFRLFSEKFKSSHRRDIAHMIVMDKKHGSRLKDGEILDSHDDWDCLQDMAKHGLITPDEESFDLGVSLSFTELGYHIVYLLRKFKCENKNIKDFHMLIEIEDFKEKVRSEGKVVYKN